MQIVRVEPDGKRMVLAHEFDRERRDSPNGVAFTPDEIFIYLVDTTGGNKTIVRYTVSPDDTFGPGQSFMDVTSDDVPGGPDGMKLDQKGNLYRTRPGGPAPDSLEDSGSPGVGLELSV